MKIARFSLVLTAFVLVLSSCQHNSSATNCINTFPFLANGHSVHYSLSGSFFLPDTGQDVSYSSTSTSGVFMVTSISDQGTLNYTSYYRPCNDKLYSDRSLSTVQTTANYEEINNAPLNTAWTETVSGNTYNYKIIAKAVSVTVPAGTYSCDEVTYHDASTINTDTIFVNSNVGYVKYNGAFLNYELHHKNF